MVFHALRAFNIFSSVDFGLAGIIVSPSVCEKLDGIEMGKPRQVNSGGRSEREAAGKVSRKSKADLRAHHNKHCYSSNKHLSTNFFQPSFTRSQPAPTAPPPDINSAAFASGKAPPKPCNAKLRCGKAKLRSGIEKPHSGKGKLRRGIEKLRSGNAQTER